MKTRYEINKLKALILYILKESGGTLDFITLFKKMYYVQQRYLVTYGKPAFSDKFRAVKLGPVPSFTYKAFRSLLDEDTHVSEEMKAFSQAFQVKEVEQPQAEEEAEQAVNYISGESEMGLPKVPLSGNVNATLNSGAGQRGCC